MTKHVITDPKVMIYTLWGWRKSADSPELLTAWDEIDVDENRDGWNEDCRKKIESIGDELNSYRYAQIRVSYDAIINLWAEPKIDGEIK